MREQSVTSGLCTLREFFTTVKTTRGPVSFSYLVFTVERF